MRKFVYCFFLLLFISSFSYGEEVENGVFEDRAYHEFTHEGYHYDDYEKTFESDDDYERIKETKKGIKIVLWWYYQTFLKHDWHFNVVGGDTVTFSMEAKCDRVEDYFYVYYYTESNPTLYHLFTVNKNTATLYEKTLPSNIKGKVYIRVEDTDKTWGNAYQDSIYVDEMYFKSECISTKADNIAPIHEAVDVEENIVLEWEAACSSVSDHDVYFGDSYDNVLNADTSSDEYKDRQTGTTFSPEDLESNKEYYWRIDEMIGGNVHKGDVWSFKVYEVAHIPDPKDETTDVHRESVLSWESSSGKAASYDIYFGKNFNDVAGASHGSQAYKGNIDDPSVKTFDPGTLEMNTCYYWRIDEIDSQDVVHPSPVWSFFVPGLREEVPVGMNPAIGGGEGYTDIINVSDFEADPDYQALTLPYNGDLNEITTKKFMIVDNEDTLLEALNNADSGDFVYIGGETEINLTGENNIIIPGGVTLCGQRGKEINNTILKGALLYTNEYESEDGSELNNQCLFFIGSPNVRVTGLRIRGPLHNEDNANKNERRGISIRNEGNNAEIENCELFNWGQEAIGIITSGNDVQKIHHNYIHDARNPFYDSEGGGANEAYNYGIFIAKGFPNIYANVFRRLGHSIAGDGSVGCSYEAQYNIVLAGLPHLTNSDMTHQFDMHGRIADTDDAGFCWQYPLLGNINCRAGSEIYIHHNTFSWTSPGIRAFAIQVRGRPRIDGEIHNNLFFHQTIDEAVRQSYRNGNLDVSDNLINFDLLEGCIFETSEQGKGTWTNYWPNEPPY